jgi:GH25 family lysozyme M1 (1,4-beta-N-acetylmuramidase)
MNDLYVPMIDTSAHQFAADGTTGFDPAVAAAAGVEVNMMRAGRGMRTGNATVNGIDRALATNHRLTVAAGMKWACYWRCDNLGEESADMQADRFVNAVEALPSMTSAPLVIDVEAYDGPQLGIGAVRDWLNEFRHRIEFRGHSTAVYSGAYHWNTNVRAAWGDLPLLIAQWPKLPDGSQLVPPANARLWPGFAFGHQDGPTIPEAFMDWDVWQFTSKGTGLGSTVNTVDCNVMKRSAYEGWWFGA